ncbi:cell death abnormality protein 1-like [Haliotis rubra]|uniref:cell death abnormality protein 1-like n=1 Tax=Haliotis rubra TaxID=36100 RepID=UPI001EE57449|nr:cell death abnormality protein 1-like [Haliotis rubra]
MSVFHLMLHILFIERISGTPRCSVSDTNVHCYPCTDICDPQSNSCFKCPKQCDSTVNKDACTSVCSEQCLDNTCEYVNANLKCSDGCQEGRTGSYCQEFCPHDCATCDQHTSVCTSCRDGHETCTRKGLGLCSVSDTNVRCLPCSEVCNPKVNKCFSCPIQCGKSISVDRCDSVCNENCLHGRCEYENGKLKCSAGCENGRTGISCQEFCPPQCKTCDQFTSACTQCASGYGENCTEVTKPNCCPESSITEIQCKVIKQNVCREHQGCFARKPETTSDCIEIIKETPNVSSCSFECVQQLCTPFLNFSTCAELDFNDDPAGRPWTVWLICGFDLFAVLVLACLTIRCIMRRKRTVAIIESVLPELPEVAEDDLEQNTHFTFALGAIGV